jgi:hypothetical protein
VDWDRVQSIAQAFEVEAVFCSNLIALSGLAIPDHVLESAARREREARAFALARTLVLVELVGLLEDSGIPVILLKGPALGVTAYGDASMRTFSDIDLLVHREDLLDAKNLLLRLGYTRDYRAGSERALIHGDHALEFSKSGTKVELHCALLERYLRFDLGSQAVWHNATTIDIAGHRVKVLDSPRLLVFICAHGAKHQWPRVRWICDVAQLADRLTAEEIRRTISLARAARAQGILALGLRLGNELFGQDITAFGVDYAVRRIGALVNWVLLRLGLTQEQPTKELWMDRVEPRASALLFWSMTRDAWSDRLAPLMRVAFVPTENDTKSGHLAWITRPLRLAARMIRRAI